MNKQLEIRQLEAIIKLQESKATPIIYRPVFMPAIWVICGAVILSSEKAYEAELLHPYLFISIVMVMGVGIGFHVVYKASYKAWPILGSYVNTDEIKEHLIKLKT